MSTPPRFTLPARPLTAFALLLIDIYQRNVSPLKGFVCAYRVHTGCASCSALGYRAIQRYGVWRGIQLLRKRTYLCGVAHRRFLSPQPHYPLHQRGECDLGCDSPFDGDCDFKGSRVASSLCDGISCCDFGSNDSSKKSHRKRKRIEAKVHLPRRQSSRV